MTSQPFEMVRSVARIGRINWIGFRTLYIKEVQRFLKVATQTVMAPVTTTLIFLAVFALALGGAVKLVAGVPLVEFLAPGLIMMAITQNAFANTSSSLLISKMQGNIVDVLMAPLSSAEVTLAYLAAGMTRGLVVGTVVGLAMLPFAGIAVAHWGIVFFFATAASLLMAELGVVAGLWADKFDHAAAITNFIVTPLAFLSGTFYSVQRLPGPLYAVSQVNPFFFMIDGFRYGFIDHADGSLLVGGASLVVLDLGLGLFCHRLIARGYKLKA